MCHHKSGYKMFISSEDTVQTIGILNVCCDLDTEHSNPMFSPGNMAYGDLLLKFGCKNNSFGCKQIIVENYTIEMVMLSPQCDLDLQDSNPLWSHNISPQKAAALCQVWLQKVEQFRRYLLDNDRMHEPLFMHPGLVDVDVDGHGGSSVPCFVTGMVITTG